MARKLTLTLACDRCGKEHISHPNPQEVNSLNVYPAAWLKFAVGGQTSMLCEECRQSFGEWMGRKS